MDTIIKTTDLTKTYDQSDVIKNVNFTMKSGEIYGLLGLNGAGKSTLMKMIMNLVKPTQGVIEVFGQPLQQNSYEYFKRTASIIESPLFYERLTAIENLELHAAYMGDYNKARISQVLQSVHLTGTEKKKVSQFSLGMRQRLAIGRAIMTEPELLILDEPINGLDPDGINDMRHLLKQLSIENHTSILISSHILSEVEYIADTIGVLHKGQLLEEVAMNSIHNANNHYIEIHVDDVQKSLLIFDDILGLTNTKIINANVFRVYGDDYNIQALSDLLTSHGIQLDGIHKKHQSLEDYFLNLTKEAGIHERLI